MRQSSWARCTSSRPCGGVLAALLALLTFGTAHAGTDPALRLELQPRICTLGSGDAECRTAVQASWHATRPESLCLIVLGRPEVKRCWEGYADGTYRIEIAFAEDLTVQLKDVDLRETLASAVVRVIREALHYRHKRRDPWNLFD